MNSESENENMQHVYVAAGGRTRRVEDDWYRDNTLTRGGRAKEDGLVIQERVGKLKKQANVRCRIEAFVFIIGELCDTKRRWVSDMGMEGLLCVVDKGLPRNLCYWLATQVDVSNRMLLSPDGKQFPLSKVQVHWVFGLPIGSKPVPNKIVGDAMRQEVEQMWQLYGSRTAGGTRGITGKAIVEAVEDPTISESDFKRAFLMFALNEVICPTTCHRFSVKLLPAATVYLNAKEYDWCSLLLDHLMHSLANFAKRFYCDGYAKGCGGCTMFLAVFYVDRLRRPPVHWGIFPRLNAWSKKEVNKAQSIDRLPSGDFGKLGCIDVAYGEPHPMEARDAFPVTTTTLNRGITYGYYDKSVIRKGRKRRATISNPFKKKSRIGTTTANAPCGSKIDLDEQENEHGNSGAESIGETKHSKDARSTLSNSMHSSFHQGDLENNQVNNCDLDFIVGEVAKNYALDGGVSASHSSKYLFVGQGSLVKNNILNDNRLSYSNYDEDVEQSYTSIESDDLSGEDECPFVVGNDDNNASPGEHEGNNDNGASVAGDSTPAPFIGVNGLTSPVVQGCMTNTGVKRSRVQRVARSSQKLHPEYVDTWRPRKYRRYKRKLAKFLTLNSFATDDPVVMDCDGEQATLSTLASVCDPIRGVHINYVRVASKIYGNVWAHRHAGRSKRIMMDPTSAVNVIHDAFNILDYSSIFIGCPCDRINMLFVPVLEGKHWWAAIFSLNRLEVVVIDSVQPSNAHVLHHTTLVKLMNALDSILKHCDPSWDIGQLQIWKISTMMMNRHPDLECSGVLMLMAIKRTADRLRYKFQWDSINDERQWLVCEDVMSDHNWARETVKNLLRPNL